MLNDREYVRTSGCECPRCGAQDGLTYYHAEVVSAELVIREASCRWCGLEWEENYTLTGYEAKEKEEEQLAEEEFAAFEVLVEDVDDGIPHLVEQVLREYVDQEGE